MATLYFKAFSVSNPFLQVIGVHPGRGQKGASNDGLQGLDHFQAFNMYNMMLDLICVGLVGDGSLSSTHKIRKLRRNNILERLFLQFM